MNKKCRVVPGSYPPGGNFRVSERTPGAVQVTEVLKQTPLKRNAMWQSCGCSEDWCAANANAEAQKILRVLFAPF